MPEETHYRKLENMYHAAPCNAYYGPRLKVKEGHASLVLPIREDFYHAARAVHGSAYFKAIDDAAFFAANSVVEDVFVLTVTLNCYLVRPVTAGALHSEGRLLSQTKSVLIAEAVIRNDTGQEIARGSGSFMRSKIPLNQVPGYSL